MIFEMRLRFAVLGVVTIVLIQMLGSIAMTIRYGGQIGLGAGIPVYLESIKEHPGMLVGEIFFYIIFGLAIGYAYEWIWNKLHKKTQDLEEQ